MACDESYRDAANVAKKILKHQAFEAEITANQLEYKRLCQVYWKTIFLPNCSNSEKKVKYSLENVMFLDPFRMEKICSLKATLDVKMSQKE